MFRIWHHYFSVYLGFISTNITEATSYRLNFWLLIFMDLLFYASTLTSVYFIFGHVEQIGPWQREQFLFFMCFMLAVDHLHMTFVSENFWQLSDDIRQGQLDYILLRPIGSLFPVFFRNVRIASFCNAIFIWPILVSFARQAGLEWQMMPIMFLLLFLALALIVSLEILISMSMFWTVESFGINFLRMQFQQLSRWPDFVYRYTAQKFFTIAFPILLVGSGPVPFLLNTHDYTRLVWMFVALIIAWAAIGLLWRAGLRHYESASS